MLVPREDLSILLSSLQIQPHLFSPLYCHKMKKPMKLTNLIDPNFYKALLHCVRSHIRNMKFIPDYLKWYFNMYPLK